MIIHLRWILLELLSQRLLTHCLHCNFSITYLVETWWNIQWMNFIGYRGGSGTLVRCNFRCMKNPKDLTYIVRVVMNMKQLDCVFFITVLFIHRRGNSWIVNVECCRPQILFDCLTASVFITDVLKCWIEVETGVELSNILLCHIRCHAVQVPWLVIQM